MITHILRTTNVSRAFDLAAFLAQKQTFVFDKNTGQNKHSGDMYVAEFKENHYSISAEKIFDDSITVTRSASDRCPRLYLKEGEMRAALISAEDENKVNYSRNFALGFTASRNAILSRTDIIVTVDFAGREWFSKNPNEIQEMGLRTANINIAQRLDNRYYILDGSRRPEKPLYTDLNNVPNIFELTAFFAYTKVHANETARQLVAQKFKSAEFYQGQDQTVYDIYSLGSLRLLAMSMFELPFSDNCDEKYECSAVIRDLMNEEPARHERIYFAETYEAITYPCRSNHANKFMGTEHRAIYLCDVLGGYISVAENARTKTIVDFLQATFVERY